MGAVATWKSYVLLGALLTSECAFLLSPATGDIRLFVIGEPGSGGGTLVIRLDNESDRALTYNLCFSTVERWSVDHWEAAQVGPAGGVCPTTRRRLEAGASADGFFALAESLTAGTYRLATSARFDDESRSFRVTTPDFTLD